MATGEDQGKQQTIETMDEADRAQRIGAKVLGGDTKIPDPRAASRVTARHDDLINHDPRVDSAVASLFGRFGGLVLRPGTRAPQVAEEGGSPR